MRNKVEEILNDILLDSEEGKVDVNNIYAKLEQLKKLEGDPESLELVMGDEELTELIKGYIKDDNTSKLKLADMLISNIKVQDKASYSREFASDYKIEAQELGRSLAKDEVQAKIKLSFDDNTWSKLSYYPSYEVRYVLGYLTGREIPLNAVWIFSNNNDIWIYSKLGGSAILSVNLKYQVENVRALWKAITDMMIEKGENVENRDLEEVLQAYGMNYNVRSSMEDMLPPPKFIKSANDLVMDLFKVELKNPVTSALGPELVLIEDRPLDPMEGGKLFAFGPKNCLYFDINKNYDINRSGILEMLKQVNGDFSDERSSEEFKVVKGNYEVPPFELGQYSEEIPNFGKKMTFESDSGIVVSVNIRNEEITIITFKDKPESEGQTLKYKSELLSDEDVYNVCKLIVADCKPSEELDSAAMKCMCELNRFGEFV